MVDSKESYKFDLGVKVLKEIVVLNINSLVMWVPHRNRGHLAISLTKMQNYMAEFQWLELFLIMYNSFLLIENSVLHC